MHNEYDRRDHLRLKAGDTFGQGGWDNNAHAADHTAPPTVWLILLPFLVLLIAAAAVTVALLMVSAHRGQPDAGWTWDDQVAAIGAQL